MRILISGSSGFVGRALMEAMPEHTWVPLVRDRRKQGIFWSIEQGVLESRDLEGFDAVVHLAGESIFRCNGLPIRVYPCSSVVQLRSLGS